MELIKFLFLYLILDSIWLVGMKQLHQQQIEKIQKSSMQFDYLSAILFYLFAYLAFSKFVKPLSQSKKEAFEKGALMGFLLYMTFDLTNKAIFKEYEWSYAIKDILWGTFVFGLVSYLMY